MFKLATLINGNRERNSAKLMTLLKQISKVSVGHLQLISETISQRLPKQTPQTQERGNGTLLYIKYI